MGESTILILIILGALWFDFVNGFHDAANAIATSVSTHALSARNALILARTLNFIGALSHTAVAYTIGKGVVQSGVITLPMLLAALFGAIAWGYLTWYLGLPSSSTHALIGSLVGTALVATGFQWSILVWSGIQKILLVMIISPTIGLIGGIMFTTLFSWGAWRTPYWKSAKFFKRLQVLSASAVSFSHGMNDAQSAMGIITIALVTQGVISEFHVPLWVRVASALAMGLGTSMGGWKIIRTMGRKMVRLHKPIDGCAAEVTGGTVIYLTAMIGIPVSTTHVITSAIMGTGVAHDFRVLRWRVVRQIVLAWFTTIPGAALIGGLLYLIIKLFI